MWRQTGIAACSKVLEKSIYVGINLVENSSESALKVNDVLV